MNASRYPAVRCADANANDSNTARRLSKALLRLYAVVIAGRLFNLSFDLANVRQDVVMRVHRCLQRGVMLSAVFRQKARRRINIPDHQTAGVSNNCGYL